jgi:hypothetical protein
MVFLSDPEEQLIADPAGSGSFLDILLKKVVKKQCNGTVTFFYGSGSSSDF